MARPTLRLEPRLEEPSRNTQVTSVAIAVLGAAAMGALLVAVSGHDPFIAFAALYRGAFGSVRAISGTINKAVPIGLCALGIALAYRGRCGTSGPRDSSISARSWRLGWVLRSRGACRVPLPCRLCSPR